MCTCVVYTTKDHYFGRNLDLDFSYQEAVTVTPRRFPLPFRRGKTLTSHAAMIGMAFVADGYPLYYDAANEYGLAMAGLNYPGKDRFLPPDDPAEGKNVVSPFEFIPWILGQCRNQTEARQLLDRTALAEIPFSDQLPVTPLHWMIADTENSIVVECENGQMHVYDNPVGVMTNLPDFPYQLQHLAEFRNVTSEERPSSFADTLPLPACSRGMGGIGIPGDLSSSSRFVKAAFTRLNAVSDDSEGHSVSQFFHILGSVEQQRGCCRLGHGKYEITIYSSCINLDRGIYYVRTYDNAQISAVDMHREELDGSGLKSFPLITEQQIRRLN